MDISTAAHERCLPTGYVDKLVFHDAIEADNGLQVLWSWAIP